MKVPAAIAGEVQVGQAALVAPRQGAAVPGTVARVEPSAAGGTVGVVIRLAGVSGRPGLPVDGTIRIRSLKNVVYVGRPVFGQPDGSGALFKFEPDGAHATRVTVRFGAASVNSIQILDGLRPGDCVILSDMRAYEGNDRIRVK